MVIGLEATEVTYNDLQNTVPISNGYLLTEIL